MQAQVCFLLLCFVRLAISSSNLSINLVKENVIYYNTQNTTNGSALYQNIQSVLDYLIKLGSYTNSYNFGISPNDVYGISICNSGNCSKCLTSVRTDFIDFSPLSIGAQETYNRNSAQCRLRYENYVFNDSDNSNLTGYSSTPATFVNSSSSSYQPAASPIVITGKSTHKWKIVVGVVLGGVATIVILFLLLWWLFWRQKEGLEEIGFLQGVPVKYNSEGYLIRTKKQNEGDGVKEQILPAKVFRYADLEKATNGFSPTLKLGARGFGIVYKGVLSDGTETAIKRCTTGSKTSIHQFLNEINILSQATHPNLVKLLGWSLGKEGYLLVYEYVSNGTLAHHLWGSGEQSLPWINRLHIAIEVAEAIDYLHYEAQPPIYHRDIKSSNILLDNELQAKVADFGISCLVPMDATHVSTIIQGTPGYLDPEFYQTYKFTDKSDVYSFGVVLFELITGSRPLDFDREIPNLAPFAVHCIKTGLIHQIADPRLQVPSTIDVFENTDPRLQVPSTIDVFENIKLVAALVVSCVADLRRDRPTMKQVIAQLQRIEELLEECKTCKTTL